MIALILAGGRGTRLRPFTAEIPKPLLKIKDKAILGNQIDLLKDIGISKIIIVTGFLHEKIHSFIEENYPNTGVAFVHNAEYENSRPAFGIICALNQIDDDVLYLNGDVLFKKEILEKVVNSKEQNVTAIQRTNWDEEEVNVVVENGLIKELSKNLTKEESDGEFIGVTKLSHQFINCIKEIVEKEGKEVFRHSFAIDLINHTLNQKEQQLYPVDVTDMGAIEIDTPEDYRDAINKND